MSAGWFFEMPRCREFCGEKNWSDFLSIKSQKETL